MVPELFSRIFERPSSDINALMFLTPDQVKAAASSPEVGAWRLLLGSMAFRRAGERSSANDWLNHASQSGVTDDVFKAELLAEAGNGLYSSDRLREAFDILNSAHAVWRDVCGEAADASAPSNPKAATDFARRLLPLLEAAAVTLPVNMAEVHGGKHAVPIIRKWLEERAVVARAENAATFVRLLSKVGQIADAQSICVEETEWAAQHFTSPAVPLAKRAIEERNMSAPVRRALYGLLLGQGEASLAANEYAESAAAFGRAAAIYDGNANDYNDVNRLLRAKFNQANSLLRLDRFAEAIGIYELCEHGFNSIGDDAAAQRVAHAKLFARTKMADSDES